MTKKPFGKLISLFVAALMLLSVVPVGAVSAAAEGNGLSAFVMPQKGIAERGVCFGGKRAASAPARAETTLLDLVFNDSFEANTLRDWVLYNADGNTAVMSDIDATNWVLANAPNYAHTGNKEMISFSCYGTTPLDQDNWLVSPEITVPAEGYFLSCYALSFNAGYPDHLEILAAPAAAAMNGSEVDASAFTTVLARTEVPTAYTQYLVDLSAYAGSAIRIAFRHQDEDCYALGLDDVQVGVPGTVIDETAISLSDNSLSLELTHSGRLEAAVAPADATYKDVTWSSSNTSVAAVNNAGGVIAVGIGTATITATSHSGLTASCTVTVTLGNDSFTDSGLAAFGVYNIDTGAMDNWYKTNRFGAATLDHSYGQGDYDLVVSEYDPYTALLYGYTEVSNTYNFVSVDPFADDYPMTVIATGLTEIPMWMAYDFDNNVMYAGFCYEAADGIHFDFAKLDLATGLKGEVAVDVYNAEYPHEGEGGTVNSPLYAMPYHCTYVGGGRFIGADRAYDSLASYTIGETFEFELIGTERVSEEIGEITPQYQKMWYNPFDGVVYWAGIFDYTGLMAVIDIDTGVAAVTGVIGGSGAQYGIDVTALFLPYTVSHPHIVTFIDGLTNTIITAFSVADGSYVTPPQAPAHEGYTFVGWDNENFFNITEDRTFIAMYEPISYTLTINYVFAEGGEAAPAYTAQVPFGEAYEVESPTVAGFTPDIAVVTGAMGAADVTVTVTYTEEEPFTGLLGDVNCDGKVNMADLSALSAYMLGKAELTPQGLINADVSGDGNVDARDLPLIYQITLDN